MITSRSACTTTERIELTHNLQQHILRDNLGIGVVPQHAPGHAVNARGVFPVYRFWGQGLLGSCCYFCHGRGRNPSDLAQTAWFEIPTVSSKPTLTLVNADTRCKLFFRSCNGLKRISRKSWQKIEKVLLVFLVTYVLIDRRFLSAGDRPSFQRSASMRWRFVLSWALFSLGVWIWAPLVANDSPAGTAMLAAGGVVYAFIYPLFHRAWVSSSQKFLHFL
jgi:hypothetical protein